MAVKTTTGFVNFVEAMIRVGPDGNLLQISEQLNEMNELLQDAYMKEANDVFSHLEGVRAALPTVSSRNFNQGSTRSSSKIVDEREQLTILEPWVEIDEAIAEKQPSVSEFLATEWMAFGEAAMQEFTRQIVYGNPGSDAREIRGLANRASWDAAADTYVTDIGGGGSDTTSMWIIEWGPGKAALLYPRGHGSVGVAEDQGMGKYRIQDSSQRPYMVYGYRVLVEFGLTIPDTRSVQRLASIESSGSSNNMLDTNKVREISYSKNRLPSMGRNAVIYANRDLKAQLDILADEKTNANFQVIAGNANQVFATPITVHAGTPIRMLEQITSTETAL